VGNSQTGKTRKPQLIKKKSSQLSTKKGAKGITLCPLNLGGIMKIRIFTILSIILLAVPSFATESHFSGHYCEPDDARDAVVDQCSALAGSGETRTPQIVTGSCSNIDDYYDPPYMPPPPMKSYTVYTPSYAHYCCASYVDGAENRETALICAPDDTDEDGIDDELDPFPDSDAEFTYIKVGEWIDDQGNITAEFFKCIDSETGEVTFVTIGDHDVDDTFYAIVVGEPWQDSGDYIDMVGGEDPADVNPHDDISEIDNSLGEDISENAFDDIDHGDDFAQGDDSTGNTTDTEHLADIVDNTKVIADNQNTQGEILEEISDKLSAIGKIEYHQQTNPQITVEVESESGPTAEEIADAITGDGTGLGLSPDVSGLDTAQGNAEDAFDTTNDLSVDAPTEYQQKTDISDKIDEIENNTTVQSIKNIFTDSELDITSSPCLNYDYNGNNIAFCVDKWDTELTAWGVIMLSLVSLHSLLIVFRRR